jgi:hypothetical protein
MRVPQETTTRNCDRQLGQWVQGKGIVIGAFDLFDAYNRSLGIRTRWYDTAIELGKPMTFDDTANAVANCNVNGRGGLRLNPGRYEVELFEKLKTGEALSKNVIAPLEVVRAIYSLRNKGEYKSRSSADLPGRLITSPGGTGFAHWQYSCTRNRDDPNDVRAVDFGGGNDGWLHGDFYRLSGRVCFAELAP